MRPRENMLPVCIEDRWALFSLEMDFRTDFRFDYPPVYNEGIIRFIENGRPGVMDLEGNELIADHEFTAEKTHILN